MIEFKNISVGYDKQVILSNINLNINKGKITTFLGPNGSGKTTLMSTLNRLITPISGEILVDGVNILSLKRKELCKIIASVPQFHTPNFSYSVFDIVMTGRTPHIGYMPLKLDFDIVDDVIEKVGIMHLKEKEYTKLSGGERQLVLIARALAVNAKIILLDEPTSYLDFKNSIKVLRLIKDLNEKNKTTFVMTLHDPNQALAFSHETVIVNKGNVYTGITEEIINSSTISELYDIQNDIIEHRDCKYILAHY